MNSLNIPSPNSLHSVSHPRRPLLFRSYLFSLSSSPPPLITLMKPTLFSSFMCKETRNDESPVPLSTPSALHSMLPRRRSVVQLSFLVVEDSEVWMADVTFSTSVD